MKQTTLAFLFFAAALATPLAAQYKENSPTMTCDDEARRHSRWEQHCEIREQTVAYGGLLNVDANRNGGVSIKGWNRPDVLVRMKISSHSVDEAAAKALAAQVRLTAGAGLIAADGPTNLEDQQWSASFEVMVPHAANLKVSGHNGGISIADVVGTMDFQTHNGGISLARVGGTVKGETHNGGIHVELAGSRWEGSGLELTTVNGGIHFQLPSNYSAQVDASTMHGGFSSDFGPAPARHESHMSVAIGAGGAMLKVTTRNGGVRIARS